MNRNHRDACPIPSVERYVALLATLLGLTTLGDLASAAIVRVPDDQPTIQAGLDAATEGDTILVAAGTYSGPGNREIDFGGRDLVLVASEGPAATIIKAALGSLEWARGFIFQGGESSAAVIDGFTIRDFKIEYDPLADGGPSLLIIGDAEPTIRDCIFESNQCTDCEGGAVLATGGTFERCVFRDNHAEGWNDRGKGGAIACRNSVLINCIIEGNRASESDFSPSIGGGIACGPFTQMIGCTVTENSASFGGGVSVLAANSGPFDVWMIQCTIADNDAWRGGAAMLATSASPTTTGDRFNQQMLYMDRCIVWSDGECGPSDILSQEEVDGSLRLNFICSDVDTNRIVGSASVQFDPNTISEDPLFCDPRRCDGSPFGTGDYRLLPDSPCRAENSPCGAVMGSSDLACDEVAGSPAETSGSRVEMLGIPWPNPARMDVQCGLVLPASSSIHAEVIDTRGAFVREITRRTMTAGRHELIWDLKDRQGRRVPAGVYWLRTTNNEGVDARPIVVAP